MKLVKKMRNASIRILKPRRKDSRDGKIGNDRIHRGLLRKDFSSQERQRSSNAHF
jgi:hypothetical protein